GHGARIRALGGRVARGTHLGHEHFRRRGDVPRRVTDCPAQGGVMRNSSVARSISRSPASEPPRPAERSGRAAGSLLFVVDDDASVRKSLDRLLSAAGYRVQTFDSGREFLGRTELPGEDSQCLILDVRMPGINGLELQTSMRNSGSTIPIVFSTGFGDVTSSVRAMKVGAVDFLTKPIDEDELLAAVQRGLALDAETRQLKNMMNTLIQRLGRLRGRIGPDGREARPGHRSSSRRRRGRPHADPGSSQVDLRSYSQTAASGVNISDRGAVGAEVSQTLTRGRHDAHNASVAASD